MTPGELFVVSTGGILMPQWSANSWDSLLMVGTHSGLVYHVYLCISMLWLVINRLALMRYML